MREHIKTRYFDAYIRKCWVRKDNLRLSWESPENKTEIPAWRALVLESITVREEHRQQGHCRSLIEKMVAEPGFDLVIVEGVQNPHLADALLRWGWDIDAVIMDFYKFTKT